MRQFDVARCLTITSSQIIFAIVTRPFARYRQRDRKIKNRGRERKGGKEERKRKDMKKNLRRYSQDV